MMIYHLLRCRIKGQKALYWHNQNQKQKHPEEKLLKRLKSSTCDMLEKPRRSGTRYWIEKCPDVTWDILVVVAGSSGRLNFFCEPMAAGKEGAENMAATELIILIHDSISSGLLQGKQMWFWQQSALGTQAAEVFPCPLSGLRRGCLKLLSS